jgi:hypothetical protein
MTMSSEVDEQRAAQRSQKLGTQSLHAADHLPFTTIEKVVLTEKVS